MLTLNFAIQNPFHKLGYEEIYQDHVLVTKNKTLEFGFYKYSFNVIELDIDLRFTGFDHAGPSLSIGLFGFVFSISLSDNRHWNSITNKWEDYENTNCQTNH